MCETDAHIAVITETWMKDGRECENLQEDLRAGSGIGSIFKNRIQNDHGVAHGGVAVLWRIGRIDFRQVDIKGGADFEILTLSLIHI